ncbi:MAG: hypothetical protein QOH58_1064 [Thermoleophilaceae bacterium]|nr:hypothetical protein [Thermoleophilaceae bacterium]
MPTFCRHNRLLAECSICSKGTVLDPNRVATRSRTPSQQRTGGRRSTRTAPNAARSSRGPFVSAGPYDGSEIRLERVPGGLRLAAWRDGEIERTAPVVDAADLPTLMGEAAAKDLLPLAGEAGPAGPPAEPGVFAASAGRSGELRDELRVERLDGGRVRVARWIMRPNRGWELQQAPVLLPAKRFAQALSAAAAKGVLASDGPGE